jgi:MFS-type transporter involved in bile tolerance (Atg22 family)
MFVISGGTYAILAPIVGKICDTCIYPKKVMVMGPLLVIASCVAVGPAPYIPIPT